MRASRSWRCCSLGRDLTDADCAHAAQLVEACGGREIASEIAASRLASALGALDRIDLVPEAVSELAELANFVVERQF